MIAEFDTTGSSDFRNTMIAATGGCVSIIFIATAVYMLIHSSRKIKGNTFMNEK